MKIEIGKTYKSRREKKIRVVAKMNHDTHPMVCVVERMEGENDYTVILTDDGKYYSSTAISSYDIISEWIDGPKVDWSKYPPEVNAVVQEESGYWFGHEKTPTKLPCRWGSRGGHIVRLFPSQIPKFTGSWENSLAIRPGYKAETQKTNQ